MLALVLNSWSLSPLWEPMSIHYVVGGVSFLGTLLVVRSKALVPIFPQKAQVFLFLLFLHERNFLKKKKKPEASITSFQQSHFPKKMINPQKCKGVRDEETGKPPLRKASFFHGLSQKSSLTLWKLSEKECCNLTLPQKEITVKSNNSTAGTTTTLIIITLTLTPLINTHH